MILGYERPAVGQETICGSIPSLMHDGKTSSCALSSDDKLICSSPRLFCGSCACVRVHFVWRGYAHHFSVSLHASIHITVCVHSIHFCFSCFCLVQHATTNVCCIATMRNHITLKACMCCNMCTRSAVHVFCLRPQLSAQAHTVWVVHPC